MAKRMTLEIEEIRVVITDEGSPVLETYDLAQGEWGAVAAGDEAREVLQTLIDFIDAHAPKAV